jgi:uncharacterized phiE125 gp8 family phage protein
MSVPLSTIKSALRIDYDDDDADLIRLREAAMQLVERDTGRALTQRTETLYLSDWNDSVIPGFPFASVTTVNYVTAAGSQTMPATDWWIDLSDGPMPVLRFLQAPARKDGTMVTVTYACGHDALPDPLTHCVIALVGAWYNNPEAFQPIGLNVVPMSVGFIMDSYRVRSPIR